MIEVCLGIDLGGTNTVFGLVDKQGKIHYEGSVPTASTGSPEEWFAFVWNDIKSNAAGFHISGVGIGAPNGNYYNGCIEFAPNLSWEGVVPLSEIANRICLLKTVVTNDANAAAIGEKLYGGAQEMSDFVVITLGTGVGSGIFSNGKVLYGHDGFAGEVGHVVIVPDGRECGCGRKGCLETYASAGGVVRSAHFLLYENKGSAGLLKYGADELSSKNIFDEAIKGDETALKVFDMTAKMLALGLANTVAVTSPEAIFLFGGLSRSGDILLNPLKYYFEEYLLKVYKGKVKLLLSELNDKNAGVLGAAALIWNEI